MNMKPCALRIMVVFILAAAVIQPVFAQTITPTPPVPEIEAFVRYQRINVRSGPSVRFTRIGQLRREDQVMVTGRSDDGNNWLRIDFDGSEGWVAYFTVRPADVVSQLAIVVPTNPQVAIREPQVLTARVFRTVNVRQEPTIVSDKIDELKSGDEVVILGRNSIENTWLLIDHDGQEGWVAYFTVTVKGNIERIDVVEQDDDNVPLTLAGEESPVVVDTFRTVNIRSGPGMDFERIGQMASGDKAAVTGRSDTDNNWLQVDFDGETGWIAYFTVTVSGDLSALPIVEMESKP